MGVLDGRVAIVTGGGRHLGRAYALGLAAEGARVMVTDILDTRPVVDEISAGGGTADGIAVDVTDQAATQQMADSTLDRFGRIDVLVNNAGHYKQAYRGPFEEIPADEWDKAFDVNVRGTWLCCRAVAASMKAQRYGKIINVGSNTVTRGIPGFLHYVAAKSAITGLTRALARELGEFNICVNTLAPDFIPDDEQREALPDAVERGKRDQALKRTEVPDDMIGSLVFLAGSGSDFVTGQSVLVNGGSYMQ